MKYTPFAATICSLSVLGAVSSFGHEGLVAGHSPPDPNGTGECPTLEPLRLFIVPATEVGGEIVPGAAAPAQPGVPTALVRIALNALLARPEFGGFVYVEDNPGFDYANASLPCHALTTDVAGGPFTVSMQRTYWPDGVNFAIADPFGSMILREDGDTYQYGTESVSHVHPFWLARRAGTYHAGLAFTSSFFLTSAPFSVSFVTTPACGAAVPIDLSSVFNADVVDSSGSDAATAFDTAGRSWVLSGHLGATAGLPADGVLDVFQLGGPSGARLGGSLTNCLFDNGTLSAAAAIDLDAQGASGAYESLEVLIGSAGTFANADRLVVRMHYASGTDQVVNVRRAAANPVYFPLLDWNVNTSPLPQLSVGRSGSRSGGGFQRSTGAVLDAAGGANQYFQRVTFPVDPARALTQILIDDYTGAGRVGIFAITAIAADPCRDGDANGDGAFNAGDLPDLSACLTGPDNAAGEPCLVFDAEYDDDVDMRDFAALQGTMTP
jgi:hypothetical protein